MYTTFCVDNVFLTNRIAPVDRLSIKGLKIGIPKEYYNEHLSEEVLEVWNETARILADGGATIKEVSCKFEIVSLFFLVFNRCPCHIRSLVLNVIL